jgi:transcriptional regulator with XRE-family HTH domain
VKTLRKERGWSQADLATHVGGDAGQISRYENGKISPSIDVVVKLSEAFDVATDYLLVEGTARRPFRAPTDLLGERPANLDQLSDDDRAALIHIIDGCSPTPASATPSPAKPAEPSALRDPPVARRLRRPGRPRSGRFGHRRHILLRKAGTSIGVHCDEFT